MGTHFYTKLLSVRRVSDGRTVEGGYNYANVKGYSRPRRPMHNLFSRDILLIPINFLNVHWALAVIRLADRTITLYDSLSSTAHTDAVYATLTHWLKDEYNDKPEQRGGYELRENEWCSVPPREQLQQNNGFDCGVFMLMAAYFVACGHAPDVHQDDIAECRQRIALACIRRELACFGQGSAS